MRASIGVLLSCVIACSSSSSGSSGTHDMPDAADTGGTLPLGSLMPQEVAGNATAVMATPTVVAITYDGDTSRNDIEAFYSQYAKSSAWAAQTAEYGIGPLAVGTPIHLTGKPPASDTALHQVITTNLTGATPAWGAPSQNTLYSITLPLDTPFIDDTGRSCCGGYHDDIMVGTTDVAYSVQCPCTGSFPPPTTPLQALTFALAHELVEAATDPRYEHDYAWGAVDPAHQVWSYVTDGELADLCEFTQTVLWSNAPDMTYTISRIWSNAAARAGSDPCVGAPTTPYYQSVPEQPDDVTISLFGGDVATKGTKVAMGAAGTVTVRIAGTPGSGPFRVTGYDVATILFGATTPFLTFVQPSEMFEIGDTVSIPVTVVAKDGNLGGAGAEAFEIDTQPINGGPTTYFYGLVAQ
jgi:hypothetical protein